MNFYKGPFYVYGDGHPNWKWPTVICQSDINGPIISDTWPLLKGPLYTGPIFNIGHTSVRNVLFP